MFQEDDKNYRQISKHISSVMSRTIKILPENWEMYSEDAGSFSQIFLKLCSIPEEIDEETYWSQSLCYLVQEKYCSWKGNLATRFKEQFMSEFHSIQNLLILLF